MTNLNLLKTLMQKNEVQRLYFKFLSPNDNSKNQVYFGQGFSALNIIPLNNITPNTATKQPGFTASFQFAWIDTNGRPYIAPGAQLILYPQYPEVRFSGFLAGCKNPPSELMTSREEGRILFLGITTEDTVVGHVVSATSPIAKEIADMELPDAIGVFQPLPLETAEPYKQLLIETLAKIHDKCWIDSRRLLKDGSSIPYKAPNGGGYTLEAEFGITPNGSPIPDIWGWEIKQHGVNNFSNIDIGAVTLMTPEPTGGYYKEHGIKQFMHKFGYADKSGIEDRLNFGGIHIHGRRTEITGLTLTLLGYDQSEGKIESVNGGLALFTDNGDCAAIWHYTSLMEHWNKKHAQAAYVPSMKRKQPSLQYRYGPTIRLGIGTEFLLFLKAVSAGTVYYDPGIKMEQASSKTPNIKKRSQFRIKTRNLEDLYKDWEIVNLT